MLREKLAEMYESEHQWSKAAQMLSGIDLDSGIRLILKFFLEVIYIYIYRAACLDAFLMI